MKKLFRAAFAVIASVAAACTQVYDPSALEERVGKLEARVSAIEALNTTVSGISDIVNALNKRDYVSSVIELQDSGNQVIGYVISFAGGDKVTVYNGLKGDQGPEGPVGPTPSITVRLGEDGLYYWVIEGELLKDAAGNPVPCTQLVPKFKIENGQWWVSYDGTSWSKLGLVSHDGTNVEVDNSNEEYVLLTINGTEVQIPKEKPFFLRIQYNTVGVIANISTPLAYQVQGAGENEEVTVDVICTTPGISARIEKTGNTSGNIVIETTDVYEGKVVVYADNNKGKTSIKSIVLEGGVIAGVSDVAQAPSEGGEIALSVKTNIPHHLVVPDYYDWVHVADTKATVQDIPHVIVVDPNETTGFRYVAISVVTDATNEVLEQIDIVQKPAEGITALYSIESLPNGTKVVVNGTVVVAVSKKGAIVSDASGYGTIYLEGSQSLAVGDSLSTLVGIKRKNEQSTAPYIELASAVVAKKAITVPDTKWVYIGSAENYYIANTSTTAKLQKDEKGFYVQAPTNFDIRIEEPLESLNLDAYVGKYISISGYMSEVIFYGFDFASYKSITDLTMIVNSVKEVTFTENKNWKLSYDGKTSDNQYYPEKITNTVSEAGERYALAIVSKKQIDEFPVQESVAEFGAVWAADDVQYAMSSGGLYMSKEQIYELETYAETGSATFAELVPGIYYAVAAGVDTDGNPTGSYSYTQFEVIDPHMKAAYEDFLGTWSYKSGKGYQKMVVKEKEKGSTYTLELGDTVLPGGVNPTAVYDSEAGQFTLSMQSLGEWEKDGITMVDQLCPIFFTYDNEIADNTRYMNGNTLLLTARMFKDGTVDMIPGMDSYSPVEGIAVLAGVKDADTREYIMSEPYPLPAALVEYIPLSKDYLAWLGNWTVTTNGQSYDVTIQQSTPNSDYIITGMNGFGQDYIQIPNYFDGETGELYLIGGDQYAAGSGLYLGDDYEKTYSAYFLGLVEYENQLYPIQGAYALGAGKIGADGTATFRPGSIQLEGSSEKFTFAAQGLHFISASEPETLYTLDGEIVTSYPFTMKRASAPAKASVQPLGKMKKAEETLRSVPSVRKVAKASRPVPSSERGEQKKNKAMKSL